MFTTREPSGGMFVIMEREYTWSSLFAWGLTLSGASLATSGVIGMFWPKLDIGWICIIAFACMMAFGIGLVNCAAAAALHAIKHRKPDGRQVEWAVFLPALACCLGFTFATNVGVHLGWEIVIANAPVGAKLPVAMTIDAVFYIFAFAKPAMAWIVEGRKAMDAEDHAALKAARRRDAADMADAEAARDAMRAAVKTEMTAPVEAAAPEAAKTPESVAEAVEMLQAAFAGEPQAEDAPKPRSRREKRKPKTVEEQRAAAMKAAARRVASFREQHMARVHDIEQARAEQSLTPLQIARACDALIERGEKPTIRRVAEILGVSQLRIEKAWPQGVPLDGTGEVRAA